jgi:hypothetical protein
MRDMAAMFRTHNHLCAPRGRRRRDSRPRPLAPREIYMTANLRHRLVYFISGYE